MFYFSGCPISPDQEGKKKSSEIGLLAKSDNSSEIEHSKLYIEIKNDLLTQCCLLAVLVSSTRRTVRLLLLPELERNG